MRLVRWSWIGRGTKIRCHEASCDRREDLMGEWRDCTISAYQHVRSGAVHHCHQERQC